MARPTNICLLLFLLLPITACAASQPGQMSAIASALSQYYPQLKTQEIRQPKSMASMKSFLTIMKSFTLSPIADICFSVSSGQPKVVI